MPSWAGNSAPLPLAWPNVSRAGGIPADVEAALRRSGVAARCENESWWAPNWDSTLGGTPPSLWHRGLYLAVSKYSSGLAATPKQPIRIPPTFAALSERWATTVNPEAAKAALNEWSEDGIGAFWGPATYHPLPAETTRVT